jgi:hypothetical protein
MRTAVLQTTAIYIFSMIFMHYQGDKVFEQVWENEGYRNMSAVLESGMPYNSTNSTSRRLTLGAGDMTNRTFYLPTLPASSMEQRLTARQARSNASRNPSMVGNYPER